MDIPYEESLLHSRWVNGLNYLKECNPEDDKYLIHTHVKLLTTVAATAVNSNDDIGAAMITGMGVMLRLGYYLGQNGVDAGAPNMTPEYIKEQLVPIINPGCDCDNCQAKIDLLKEYGVDYEITPERQEMADSIEEEKQVSKTVKDTFPFDDFDPRVN